MEQEGPSPPTLSIMQGGISSQNQGLMPMWEREWVPSPCPPS